MISCQFPVRHRIFQFEIVRTEMIAKHVDLVRQSCIVSAFATTNYPDKIFQGVRLYTYSRIAGCSTPLRPVLHADNTGKREFVLRVLDADVKRFMMPKDVLYIGLFSIGEIFQIFGIERLAYRKISFHLHPTLCERNDGEFRHTQFYFRNRACVGGENHVTGTKGMIPKRMPVFFAPHTQKHTFIS